MFEPVRLGSTRSGQYIHKKTDVGQKKWCDLCCQKDMKQICTSPKNISIIFKIIQHIKKKKKHFTYKKAIKNICISGSGGGSNCRSGSGSSSSGSGDISSSSS